MSEESSGRETVLRQYVPGEERKEMIRSMLVFLGFIYLCYAVGALRTLGILQWGDVQISPHSLEAYAIVILGAICLPMLTLGPYAVICSMGVSVTITDKDFVVTEWWGKRRTFPIEKPVSVVTGGVRLSDKLVIRWPSLGRSLVIRPGEHSTYLNPSSAKDPEQEIAELVRMLNELPQVRSEGDDA